MRDSIEFDLKDLSLYLLRRIHWVILAMLLGLATASIVTTGLITPLYTSSVQIYVSNHPRSGGDPAALTLGDLTASQMLANTFVVILGSDDVLDEVALRLVEEYSADLLGEVFTLTSTDGGRTLTADSLREAVEIFTIDDTAVLQIEAATPNPEISARICLLIAEVAPEIFSRIIGAGSVQIIGRAAPASRPSSPNLAFNLAFGIFIGLVISVAAIMIRYFTDTSIKGEDDFARHFALPVLGVIPEFPPADKKKTAGIYSAIIKPQTPPHLLEAYKRLRVNISFALADFDGKIIAVTSALPGEGKSSTCANIAQTVARTSSKTLIVDADFRNPVQDKIFNLANDRGLSELLSGYIDDASTVTSPVADNLDVITSGRIPEGPSELLGLPDCAKHLKDLAMRYEYIFVDSSPVNIAVDVVMLSSAVSGVLLVVREDYLRCNEFAKALEILNQAKAKIIGVIINDAEEKAAPKYYDKYSS